MGVGDDTLPRVEVERAEDLKGVTMYVIRTRVGGASTTVRKRHAARAARTRILFGCDRLGPFQCVSWAQCVPRAGTMSKWDCS
jgi:hypothetical protein